MRRVKFLFCSIFLLFMILFLSFGGGKSLAEENDSSLPIWYKFFSEKEDSFLPTMKDDIQIKWMDNQKAVAIVSQESGTAASWDPYVDYHGTNYSSGIFRKKELTYNKGITVAAQVMVPETVVEKNPDLTFTLRGSGQGKELLTLSSEVVFTELNNDGSVKKGVWQTVYAYFEQDDSTGKVFTGLRISFMKSKGGKELFQDEATLYVRSICVFESKDKALDFYQGDKVFLFLRDQGRSSVDANELMVNVYPYDSQYKVRYTGEDYESDDFPTKEGRYQATFTLEGGIKWHPELSTNSQYTLPFYISSNEPSEEIITFFSEEDTFYWLEWNLNNLPKECLSFDEGKKAAKIVLNKPASDPGIYFRKLYPYVEEHPYMVIGLEVEGNSFGGSSHNLYTWGENGLTSILGADRLTEGKEKIIYYIQDESPTQFRWDPYVVIPDGFDVIIYLKYVTFFSSLDAALAFNGDFDDVPEQTEKTPKTEEPEPTEEVERTAKPIVTEGKKEDEDIKEKKSIVSVIVAISILIVLLLAVVLVIIRRRGKNVDKKV